MSAAPKQTMSADEFAVWLAGQPKEIGRFELIDGVVVTMQSEKLIHVRAKGKLYRLLGDALTKVQSPCEVLIDGPLVRISAKKAFRPDGLLHCGKDVASDAIEIAEPLIVYEVLSPDSVERDHGEKVDGYFSLPSVQHYLIVDPDRRTVIHHRRGTGDDLITRIVKSGDVVLDPPGLTVAVADIFG